MSLADIRLRDPVAAWAIARTLPLEGGLVDNPHDPGGVTDHGVSLRWAIQEVGVDPAKGRLFDIDHDGDLDRQDIIGLTAEGAADIYYGCIWQPQAWGQLAPALLAWKCFDIAVNTGPKRAGKLLQGALGQVGVPVPIDGAVGPTTLAAVQAQARLDQCGRLLGALRALQADFYRRLVEQDAGFSSFLRGWLNRAAA